MSEANTPPNDADLDPPDPSDSQQPDRKPDPGAGLCLSGGGYRAMIFHVGALWRLNQLGLLPTLKRISSVSGGSITAALLGLRWNDLGFDANRVASNFVTRIVAPIRNLAHHTIDVGSILDGMLNPFSTIADNDEARVLLLANDGKSIDQAVERLFSP